MLVVSSAAHRNRSIEHSDSAHDSPGSSVSPRRWPAASEPWKHVHTRFGGWIDGVCSAAVLTRLVAESGLAALRDPVTERPYRKVSVACPDDAKSAVMTDLTTDLPAAFPDADVDTDHGVRLELPDGSWVLVRPSGTEPYVRVYAEADDVDVLVDAVRETVEASVADAS